MINFIKFCDMMVKKVASYFLVGIILFLTVITLLSIWDIIVFENVMRKILSSLFVIFVASVIILFIFAVVIKDDKPKNNKSIE